MDAQKWQKYLDLANQPDSLTSEEPRRRVEADYFVTFATDGWGVDMKILVLGCGDGYEVKLLKERGYEVTGVCYYPQEYANAVAMGLEDEVIQCDMHELPFEDATFDAVISKETLEHALCPFIVLLELNRVTKMDGRFVHYIPSGEVKQSDWYHYMCAPDWLWKDLMTKAGFNVSEIKTQLEQNRYDGYKFQERL